MRRPLISLGPLVGLIFCVVLLSLVSSPASSQLTAYSETRSFRDALEGRSMEEAISGPVDKDTSSYGDRTSNSGSPTANVDSASSSTEGGPGGDYGGASNQGSSDGSNSNAATGQMMVNIPANGNLNPTMATKQKPMQPVDDQQQQQQQPQQQNGGELEREAGPISPDFPIDGQQQMMEQQQMIMRAKQMMMGRSGRLTGPGAMPNSMLMDMARAVREENSRKKMLMKRKMLMGTGARSGRLQQEQQQQQTEEMPAGQENKYESGTMNGGSNMMSPNSSGYGKKMAVQTANGGAYDGDNNVAMQGGDQQQMMTTGNGRDQEQEQEKSYDGEQDEMAGKLRQLSKMADMKSMRAKYAKMMNANGNKGSYKKQPSNMAQSMMMSLANKAAYMASQKSQQQVAGPQREAPIVMMTMPQTGGSSSYGSGNGGASSMNSGYGSNGGSMGSMSPMSPMAMSAPMQRSNGYQTMGSGRTRAMRRANQRKAEKKISPAMMNAMLNKMLAGGRQVDGPMAQGNTGYGGGSSAETPKPMQMAVVSMLMNQPAPVRAEMLAKMMMMSSGSGGSDSSLMRYGNNNNNNNKRELYKQMMMSAMQQQQPQMDEQDNSEQEEQQEPMSPMSGSGNYGDRSSSAARPMMTTNGYGNANRASQSYGQDSSISTTPSSYSGGASTMGPTTMSYGSAMGPSQQKAVMDNSAGYGTQKSNDMPSDTKGMAQQQQQPMGRSYGTGMSSPVAAGPMMVSMRMVPKMNSGSQADSISSERQMATNGKIMQQVMQMMRMKQMAMNGGQPRKSTYGAVEQQMDMAGEMGSDRSPAMNGLRQAYQVPSAGSQQQQQEQEQTDGNEYGSQQQPKQQAAYGTKSTSEAPTPMPDSGVKGSGSGGSMNRPAMSMGMSYGQEQQPRAGDAEQQQQVNEEDQYGSAPMGQAEPFAFDYKVEDEATGNNQYRKEESDKNGVVRGSYGYMDSNSGVYRHVEYVADENGFRANIKSNEPGLSDKTSQQTDDRTGQSTTASDDGTKSSSPPSSDGAYQSPQSPSPAPPSSSSSLGGSAALQQDPTMQLQMTPSIMEDQMQQRQMPVSVDSQMNKKTPQDQQQKQMSAYQGQQQQQQQQQTSGGELEK